MYSSLFLIVSLWCQNTCIWEEGVGGVISVMEGFVHVCVCVHMDFVFMCVRTCGMIYDLCVCVWGHVHYNIQMISAYDLHW